MSAPSGEISNFSDICDCVSRDMPSCSIKGRAGMGLGAGEGLIRGYSYFPLGGIGAAVGMVFGAVKGAAVGYTIKASCKSQRLYCRDFSDHSHVDDQRVIKAIAIFKHYEPQLSQSLTDPVRVAELLSEEGVISKDGFYSVKAAANSSEANRAILEATRRSLESNYKRIEIFGDVLCTVPGNEEIGKAICRTYSELNAFMVR